MKVQFKNLDLKVVVQGREPITPQNITWEVYEDLIKRNPELKDMFIVEDKPQKEKQKEGA